MGQFSELSVHFLVNFVVFAGIFTFLGHAKKTTKPRNRCIIEELNSTLSIAKKMHTSLSVKLYPHLACSGENITTFNVDGIDFQAIRSIMLSYDDITELFIDDFKNYTNVEKIDVRSVRLQTIAASSKSLVLPSVTYLSFKHNFLSFVPSLALMSFPNLTTLVLHDNAISAVYDDDFRFNPFLKHLYISKNPLTTFKDAWFQYLHVSTLYIRGCQLKKIPLHINTTSLEYVDLCNNRIYEIAAKTFSGCSSLRQLKLASNEIKYIDKEAFSGAHNLALLDLSDNLVETLTSGTFNDLFEEQLYINLYKNPLTCSCSMTWIKLWLEERKDYYMTTEVQFTCEQPERNHGKTSYDLKVEDFSCKPGDVFWKDYMKKEQRVKITPPEKSNNISRTCPSMCTCYDERGRQYFPKLESMLRVVIQRRNSFVQESFPKVVCSYTNLTSLPNFIPIDVSFLSLSGNKIQDFDLKQLKVFQNLEALDLSDNQIHNIIADTETTLPEMKYLVLKNNRLTSLEKHVLWSFPNLLNVAFDYNRIMEIPTDIFFYNRKLARLIAGANPVTSLQEDFMENLSLTSVILRNMSLIEIPASLGELVKIKYCSLSDNYIRAVRKSAFSKCLNLKRLNLKNNRITTVDPMAFNGAIQLRKIMLSENLLTALLPISFSNISSENVVIQLLDNPFRCDCRMKQFKAWTEKIQMEDETSDVRFFCSQPLRMHNKHSDELLSDDFTCQPLEVDYFPLQVEKSCVSPVTGIVAAVAVTAIVCFLLCGVVMRKCYFQKGLHLPIHRRCSEEHIIKWHNMDELH